MDKKVKAYNNPSFIPSDPVCIPHSFSRKQDIEIAGFFAAVFAWGNRLTIINKSKELMQLMDNAPYQFIMQHQEADLHTLMHFKHRTFTTTDLLYFISFFKHHYSQHKSLEKAFLLYNENDCKNAEPLKCILSDFYHYFFSLNDVPSRTRKHIATPQRNSTCKRLNMFLRWMVRKDNNGVDFGIWNNIKPAELVCPVDVHVARVAKHFNLLTRKQTDWAAAMELTINLRQFDEEDPVKYDFALFGLGVMEKFR